MVCVHASYSEYSALSHLILTCFGWKFHFYSNSKFGCECIANALMSIKQPLITMFSAEIMVPMWTAKYLVFRFYLGFWYDRINQCHYDFCILCMLQTHFVSLLLMMILDKLQTSSKQNLLFLFNTHSILINLFLNYDFCEIKHSVST